MKSIPRYMPNRKYLCLPNNMDKNAHYSTIHNNHTVEATKTPIK